MMESRKYDTDTPIPNWPKPKYLKKKNLGKYCGTVNNAIIEGLRKKGEQEILNKFLSKKR